MGDQGNRLDSKDFLEIQQLIAAGKQEEARRFLDRVADLTPGAAGAVFLLHARLEQSLRRYEERHRFLMRARSWAAERGDLELEAEALAELALPLGRSLTNDERIANGRRALRIARKTENQVLIARATSSLAYVRVYSGDLKAMRMFPQAATSFELSSPRWVPIVCWDWAAVAFAIGDYNEVRKALGRAEGWAGPEWSATAGAVRGLHSFRTGRWDDALREFDMSNPAPLAGFLPAARIAIEFERFVEPDLRSLRAKIEEMQAPLHSLPFSVAVISDIRNRRREPDAAQGIDSILLDVMAAGRRAGWDELLVASAREGGRLWETAQVALVQCPPIGSRAEGSQLMAESIRIQIPEESIALSLSAADAYLKGGDRYQAARALFAAVTTRFRSGASPGPENRKAAEMLYELGAWRTLAELLRYNRGNSAVRHIKLPDSVRRQGASGLTAREFEVAMLASRGLTAREIGERLRLSTRTIESHLTRIRSKLGLSRKSDLIRLSIRD